MTFRSELQKRTIRTRDEGPTDGAQRNARIAAMAAAKRAASKSNKERQIASRTADAEKRTKEVMKMSQEETVTEAKHIFHVHLHPIDTRLGKMVDDKTAEPIGNKPKGDRVKLTIPATDTRSARDKATRYAAQNFGAGNVESIKYKGLHTEEIVTEANIGPNVDTETIRGIHQRAHARISDPLNKNLTYSHPGFADSIDNEFKARKELAKRGVKVDRPKHKAVFEATNTEKRSEIENVARPGSANTAALSKNGQIKTKIVEEKPTMSMPNFGLSASLIAAARQIVEKKDDVELTGGNTQVEVGPKTDDRSESDEDTSVNKKKKKLDPVDKAIKKDEQLDELSKKTLARYVRAASDDAATKAYYTGKTGDLDTAAKVSKRIRGIQKATNLITQGDFSADELARIDEIAQAIFEIGTDGLDQNGKQKGINTNNKDVTNAVLSDEKKLKMNKK